jgi:tRNA-splicing ligase RtcB
MFVISNLEGQKHPIKVWLSSEAEMDEECLRQAHNLSKLPFIHKWVALMPDTHAGKGMPIGGVIATEGVIIPNAVGVDDLASAHS